MAEQAKLEIPDLEKAAREAFEESKRLEVERLIWENRLQPKTFNAPSGPLFEPELPFLKGEKQ